MLIRFIFFNNCCFDLLARLLVRACLRWSLCFFFFLGIFCLDFIILVLQAVFKWFLISNFNLLVSIIYFPPFHEKKTKKKYQELPISLKPWPSDFWLCFKFLLSTLLFFTSFFLRIHAMHLI